MRRFSVPKKLEGYTPGPSEVYPQEALAAFHLMTGKGEIPPEPIPPELQPFVRDLMESHSIASREPSGILEGLWDAGKWDYMPTPADAIQDCYRDAKRCGEEPAKRWLRRLPSYTRLIRWRQGLCGYDRFMGRSADHESPA